MHVSRSLSEGSYTGYSTMNGRSEDHSGVQSNSYCASDARSHRGGNGIPYNDSTITSGTFHKQTPESRQNLALPNYDSNANVPNYFGHPSTELATPFHSPHHGTYPEDRQPTDFSSNGNSSIGSQFQLNETDIFEGNLFMDPVFLQDLSTRLHHNPNSTEAGQTSSEDHLLPFNTKLPADRPVAPAVLTGLYCDVPIPTTHTGRAVMPTNTTTWFASTMNCLSRGSPTPSTISPSVAAVETTHLNGILSSSHPYYNASSRAAGTYILPHNQVASLDFLGNATSPRVVALSNAFNPTMPSSRLSQKTLPSLASTNTPKFHQPQAPDYHGHDESLDTMPFTNPSPNPLVSITLPNLQPNFSVCPWQGCSTITRKKHHKSNMRNHVRTTHLKPAPPTCELCGKELKKNESLKKHLGKKHQFVPPKGVQTVRKTRADGTLFTTYQQVHDYVNRRRMEKA